MKVKRASIEDYQPYYGSDEEENTAKGLTAGGEAEDDIGKPSETEIDAMEEFELQEAQAKKNQVLRALLGGFQFTFKIEGIILKLFTSKIMKR